MQPLTMQMLTGLIYLVVGVPCGMLCRFADWRSKPVNAGKGIEVWWRDRLGSAVKSLALAVVLTGLVVEGSLVAKIPVVGSIGGSFAGIILAAPIGLAITYGSHYLFAWGKRKAEEKTGGPAQEED